MLHRDQQPHSSGFMDCKEVLLHGPPLSAEDTDKVWDVDPQMAGIIANTFMFFALAFRYPEERIHCELESHLAAFEGLFSGYGIDFPDLPAIQELQSEYVALFVNNNGFVPAIPYASPHLDDQKILMGPSYDLVTECLHGAGYELKTPVKDLEDHISLVLEFCSTLSGRLQEKGGLTPGPQLQSLFSLIFKVLIPMCEPFVAAIAEHATSPFYPAMGSCLQAFLQDMDGVLAGLLGME